jgi:hypothetical protein
MPATLGVRLFDRLVVAQVQDNPVPVVGELLRDEAQRPVELDVRVAVDFGHVDVDRDRARERRARLVPLRRPVGRRLGIADAVRREVDPVRPEQVRLGDVGVHREVEPPSGVLGRRDDAPLPRQLGKRRRGRSGRSGRRLVAGGPEAYE